MEEFKKILKEYWGYEDFRELQPEIIQSVASGRDTLGLMPTGGGKSITFQVPALSRKGVCLVVTPLIALMKDQVKNLQRQGVKAQAIYTGLTTDEVDAIIHNCIYGEYKFLYVSPERLESPNFKLRIQEMNISMITVDEAHCISQWGYDFRPSYLRIAEIRKSFPDAPVLALTATATPEVVEDIQVKLKFKAGKVFQKSFKRENLVYLVRYVEDKNNYLLKIFQSVSGTGIVYVRTRKKTMEVSTFLNKHGITATHYHAGLSNEEKDYKQQEWKEDRIRIMVSTNAFGMGIDKPEVRTVAHIDLPDSPEAYFQEAGRGGRDGKIAYAILLFSNSDKTNLKRRITASYPELEVVRRIYQALGNYFQVAMGSGLGKSFEFDMFEFCRNFSFSAITVYYSLKILQRAGYLEMTEEIDNPTRIQFLSDRKHLYDYQLENPDIDPFIKLALRLYTGLFSSLVKIDEGFLARKMDCRKDKISGWLYRLSKQNIIRYIPRNKMPRIVFMQERQEHESIFFSKDVYHDRKKQFEARVNTVIDYAQNNNDCRSVQLLNYFGETGSEPCGKCDVCRKKIFLNSEMFEQIRQKIFSQLAMKKTSLKELCINLKYPNDKIIDVVRWLEEQGEIKKDLHGVLTSKNN